MALNVSDTLTAASVLSEIRAFVEADVVPLERRFLEHGFADVGEELAALRQRVKAQGLWAPWMGVEHGGMGLSLRHYAPISEALGHSPLAHFVFHCHAPDAGNIELLSAHGTARQKALYLEPLARGEVRSCFAHAEPEHAGSNPGRLSTIAMRDGDDFVINGRKWFVAGGDGARFAIVVALTGADEEQTHASLILVPAATPGFEQVRRIRVMGCKGTGPFSHSELRFDDCRVPASNLLGVEGEGLALARARMTPGRIHDCMRRLGICERAFALMCERAAGRELAPGRPLGNQQTIQNWVAEGRTRINAARLLVLQAARRADADGGRAASVELSMIKFHVGELLAELLDRAIQVHGALGLTDDTLLSWWYRHERGARIYDGPDEMHKSAVARAVLARYAGG